MPELLQIGEEVRDALTARSAVVALESTVIAQGLPYPRSLEVGRALEAEVRRGGAVPATIAVLGGRPTVGITSAEMERIAAGGVAKLSTRDLAVAVAGGSDGATTVAATAWIANRAGIAVFATGGVGGVHRGVPRDVSADVTELGRTSLVVVCAGPKAILDLPATREALETAGVLVLGWRTAEMPAFYSRESGLPVDHAVADAAEVASLWGAQRALGAPAALLLCAPPPANAAMPREEVERAIARALDAAAAAGVSGKEITPFLLRAVGRVTAGRSLAANTALLLNNARIAADVAAALARA